MKYAVHALRATWHYLRRKMNELSLQTELDSSFAPLQLCSKTCIFRATFVLLTWIITSSKWLLPQELWISKVYCIGFEDFVAEMIKSTIKRVWQRVVW
jgi:hypothetical protein